ncbi:MAG: F0F1 ATP synthase subunit A [Deltaproteobacteria bacterium]|nr:F0F1 ATP synthase subunit A [Deltaproteobacteria bacterium]MBW2053011.1 F0F1 ATP synthase subunit A [Deltaproteobacteria bacterium]MBW2141787.1 F0F1 ATP synthase subunit A [Deltaproteobacteria bacterium]MBW2324512.1 F0F1 ATP synthase subunit A [Deltaproteobacteria bacterium]
MEDLTTISQWVFTLGGYKIALNSVTLINTWMIMGVLVIFSLLATRRTKLVPNPLQSLAELLITTFDDLVRDALELDDRRYFPLICGMFMFLFLCNVWGIIPTFEEPTKDLNTPLGLGILGFVISHYSGIKFKGLKGYLRVYFEPIPFMFPLNIVSELSRVVSISFRLYGNIMGGAIIIIVVSNLVYSLVLPPFLNVFFGLFVGTIQAFVFTMLTLVYISTQIK